MGLWRIVAKHKVRQMSMINFYLEVHVIYLCWCWDFVLRHLYPEVHFVRETNK